MKKKLTIKNFVPVVPWSQIKETFRSHYGKTDGDREYSRFLKFMAGQTVVSGGVFPGDLDRFLKNLPNND